MSGRAPGPRFSGEGGPQLEEGSLQRRRPRPGLAEAEDEPTTAAHEHCGDVQDAVAERFWLCFLQLALEASHLCPGEQGAGDKADSDPGEILGEAGKRKVLEPAVLLVPHPVLDSCMAAVAALESGHVVVGGVRDETRVAETLGHVEHRELGTGVRPLPPADEPCPLAP